MITIHEYIKHKQPYVYERLFKPREAFLVSRKEIERVMKEIPGFGR